MCVLLLILLLKKAYYRFQFTLKRHKKGRKGKKKKILLVLGWFRASIILKMFRLFSTSRFCGIIRFWFLNTDESNFGFVKLSILGLKSKASGKILDMEKKIYFCTTCVLEWTFGLDRITKFCFCVLKEILSNEILDGEIQWRCFQTFFLLKDQLCLKGNSDFD